MSQPQRLILPSSAALSKSLQKAKTSNSIWKKKMNLLRNAIKSHVSVRTIKPTHAVPSFLRKSPKRFSTETDQQQPPQPDSSVNQFLESASRGKPEKHLFIFFPVLKLESYGLGFIQNPIFSFFP